MPEAAVHEDYRPVAREYQVRPAWQVLAVQAESVAERVREASHGHLGRRVLTSNARHALASLGRCERVHLLGAFAKTDDSAVDCFRHAVLRNQCVRHHVG